MWAKNKQPGFTIVELLIVIVIIAILAAITIIAYNGIQDRAKASAASQALSNAVKKIKYWQAEQDSTSAPTSLATAGVSDSGGVTYQYTQGANGAYCITATVGSKSYKLDNTTSIAVQGGCAGHGQGGNPAITNLSTNPSVETNIAGYSGPNGSTLSHSSIRAKDGTKSVITTLPTGGSSSVGVNLSNGYSIPADFKANTTYTMSAWVYVPAGTVDVRLSAQGTGMSTATCGSASSAVTNIKDVWTRLSCQFTTGASGGLALYALNAASATSGMAFYVDSVMFTEGTTLYNYADGTYQDWTGGDNTISTGPAQ